MQLCMQLFEDGANVHSSSLFVAVQCKLVQSLIQSLTELLDCIAGVVEYAVSAVSLWLLVHGLAATSSRTSSKCRQCVPCHTSLSEPTKMLRLFMSPLCSGEVSENHRPRLALLFQVRHCAALAMAAWRTSSYLHISLKTVSTGLNMRRFITLNHQSPDLLPGSIADHHDALSHAMGVHSFALPYTSIFHVLLKL